MPDSLPTASLLERVSAGDVAATEELFPLVYDELRRLAGSFMSGKGRSTLQPTALVHEAYVKLVRRDLEWDGRRHFLCVAAKAMRQILTDYARAKAADRRPDERRRVTLDPQLMDEASKEFDLVALEDALNALASAKPEHGQLAELRIFSGLSVKDAGDLLGISESTAHRRWRATRAWLRDRLS